MIKKIILIDKNYLQKYHQINNHLGTERNKFANIVIAFEEEKENSLIAIRRLKQDLENHLINITKKYKRELKNKDIIDVNMEKGEIEYTDK